MYTVYQLFDNNFSTTNGPTPDVYETSWVITDEQYLLIEQGADMFVQDGQLLIISYLVDPNDLDSVYAEVVE